MEKVIIGIDISKLSVDISVLRGTEIEFHTVKNETRDLQLFFHHYQGEKVMVGMENTGRYNYHLYEVLQHLDFNVYVINALHLKRSMGLARGKNDKIDSKRIALFVEKNYLYLRTWNCCSNILQKIKLLSAQRRYRIKIRAAIACHSADNAFLKGIIDEALEEMNRNLVAMLDKQIILIENKIISLINDDAVLNDQFHRIQTIPGVGKVLAASLIIKTQGFTKISSARQMACYAGVAPFEYRSGTSIHSKPHVSPFADKELKTFLHLAAMSTIRLKNDLAIYYKRKVSEGKDKMLVLNAVRNKIIHCVYSLIKNNSFYQNRLILS